MWKKVFVVLVIIFAFLTASIYVFRANIKRYAMNTILKSFPLPNVALANVNFDETTGTLNLEDIKVKNPKGYQSDYLMEASSVDVSLRVITKPELLLDINRVDITNPVLYVERSSGGTWNFMEFAKTKRTASNERNKGFDVIQRAYAADTQKDKSKVLLPKTISIANGAIHVMDSYLGRRRPHTVSLYPVNGKVILDYAPTTASYEKIRLDGSCHIDGEPGSLVEGYFEILPTEDKPSFGWDCNIRNASLGIIKPYLDTYTPFIVTRGSFNMASEVRTTNGVVNGNYTMELMDLEFKINPRKSNIPFLETSVKKLTLYLTNQRGNVVIDFKQKGVIGEKVEWSLGPIAKRAIGIMAIDTIIEIIGEIEKRTKKSEAMQNALPKDIPPEVIDIFRGILQ